MIALNNDYCKKLSNLQHLLRMTAANSQRRSKTSNITKDDITYAARCQVYYHYYYYQRKWL